MERHNAEDPSSNLAKRRKCDEPNPELERFPDHCKTVEEALLYYRNRSIQLLKYGLAWSGAHEVLNDPVDSKPWGVHVQFQYRPIPFFDGVGPRAGVASTSFCPAVSEEPSQTCAIVGLVEEKDYHSVFVLDDKRGQGHFSQYLKEHSHFTFITLNDCRLDAYFEKRGVMYISAKLEPSASEGLVQGLYGEKVARRTKAHLINHIDEGIYILRCFRVDVTVQDAFALHPLLQGDTELVSTRLATQQQGLELPLEASMLAMEYRWVANNYLSFMPSRSEIQLSPLNEVNWMLVADKIQNRKDFDLYHKGTIENSDRLAEYFGQWLKALSIDEEVYRAVVDDIWQRTGGVDLARINSQVMDAREARK